MEKARIAEMRTSPLIPEREVLTPEEADSKAIGILGLCMIPTLLALLAWWVTR